jgi:hypothetical protein
MTEASLFFRPEPLARFAAFVFVASSGDALFSLGQDCALERVLALYDLLGARTLPARLPDAAPRLTELLDYHKTRWTSDHAASLDALIAEAADSEAVFVHPASAPLPSPRTLTSMAQAFEEQKPFGLAPVHQGRTGWPWLLSRAALASFPLQRLDEPRPDIPLPRGIAPFAVPDPGVTLLTSLPDEQRRIRAATLAEPVPDRALCRRLLTQAQQPKRRVAHCHRVAAIGLRLARALAAAGLPLNEELVYAAGLLHDVAKGQRGHHLAGARIVRGFGYFQAGHIVVSHTEIHWRPEDGITETALLYLADKLVKGVTLMGVEQRFRYWLDGLGDDPDDRRILLKRLKTARAIEDQVSRALNKPALDFLARRP